MLMTNGEYLRSKRESCQMSMADVSKLIGVTNTRISHLENDQVKEPSPILLKSLAKIYCIDVFDLFCRYGYLDEKQINALTALQRIEFLNDDEVLRIQQQIDYLLFLHNKGDKNA